VTEEEIGLLMGGEYPDGWDERSAEERRPGEVATDGEGR